MTLLTLTSHGPATGRPVLVLHGGGGPTTVAPLAEHFAATAQVLLPTHPGWNGTPRPGHFLRVADLAAAYLDLLRERDLSDVLVIGSSLGGWIAAEMATADTGSRISGIALVDAVGIDVDEAPAQDFFALDARGWPSTPTTTRSASTGTRRPCPPNNAPSSRATWRACASTPAAPP